MGCLLGRSMMGLMATSSTRAYATCCVSQVCCSQSPCPLSRPLLTHASARDTQKHSKAGLAQSLWDLWVLVCTRFYLSPQSVSKKVWGLILNVVSPLLLSCWGFSFSLVYGLSFLVVSNTFLSMVVSQHVANLEFSQEMSAHPSTPSF